MFQRILVPIDLDEQSSWSKAFPVATKLRATFDARLTLMTVITDRDAMSEAQWTSIAYGALVDRTTTRLSTLARDVLGEEADIRVGSGSVYGAILDAASDIEADLIVLASHRPAMRTFLLGANAERVARHARCSVMIVRE